LKKTYIILCLAVGLTFLSACGQPVHQSNVLRNPSSASQSSVPPDSSVRPERVQPAAPLLSAPYCEAVPTDEKNDAEIEAKNNRSQNGGRSQHAQAIFDEALDLCQVSQDFWQKGELESAIDALDQAYTLILGVDTDNPKDIRQKEDLRFMISKRILEIYTSRNIIASGRHKEIPRTINKHVQYEIDSFTKGCEKDFFLASYKRSGRFRQKILEELKAKGLPEELSWLPLIESGFKVSALSKARALGLWQFIASTGYKFGLNRNKYIDERLDPDKSTRSAIDYLKELHQIFGDWATVLAAYNCGEGRVLEVIRDQNINYLDNFWDLYEKLPRETARYVPRFLATLLIISDPKKFGVTLPEVDPPLPFETVTVSKQVHLKDLAEKIGICEKDLKDLNPELRYDILPNERYSLRVPPEKGAKLLAVIDEIDVSVPPPSEPKSKPPRSTFVYHRVKSGESLLGIAKRYETTVNQIIAINKLKKSSRIVVGKRLKIPLSGYSSYQPAPVSGAYTRTTTDYVTKSGDSLWNIANRFRTTAKEIQELNSLSSKVLTIGQTIRIPYYTKKQTAPRNAKDRTYTVKTGDSPGHIAKKYKMTLARFMKLNRMSAKSKIFPGQVVYVE
jgi:membrane-bound lytic murein transglycosylase D